MNAVVYARYSDVKQNEQSIDGQLRVCREFAEKEGLTIVNNYIDKAFSATNDNRPEFQRMIKDAEKKLFQFIIVYKLDRFSRNRYDSAIYKAKLKKFNVKVISATEKLGSGNESNILEAILEAMAENYSLQLSQNVTRGMRENAIKGISTGGVVPLGYKIVDRKFVIDESEAHIVRTIFNEFVNGKGKTEIANYLNSKGYRTRKVQPFSFKSFTTLLTNKVYIGNNDYLDIKRSCPAIIDKDTFEQAQNIIQMHKRTRGHKVVDDVRFILTGKLFCGMCGATMTGVSGTSKTGDKHYYYVCSTRKKYKTCKKKNEQKDFLEWYIVEQTIEYVLKPERLSYIAKKVAEMYNAEVFNIDLPALRAELKKLNEQLSTCIDVIINNPGKNFVAQMSDKYDELLLQKEDIEIEIEKALICQQATITPDEVEKWLSSFCAGDYFDMDFRKRIVDVLVHSIYLFDDKIVIYYNVTGGEQVSFIDMIDDLDAFYSDQDPPLSSFSSSNGAPKEGFMPSFFIYQNPAL